MLTEYRPISLCNFAYKVIAKVLSTRLKKILPGIISESQAAFVSGRLISDNILLAQELVHSLKTHPEISSSCVAIKTDMMKAFDRVEWQFLEDAMRVLGFDERWITWIMTCVTTVSFGVLVNGAVTKRFQPSRGIRQGDPLSPFLFILCTEILILRLNRRDTNQVFEGIKVAPSAPPISHLFFADDSLYFSSMHDAQLLLLRRILDDYKNASGQRVNFSKSSVIFGSKINDEDKATIKLQTGIDKEGGTGIYLGLPEAFIGSKTTTLRFIEEKTKKCINAWRNKYLSQGGKMVLIKAVAYALPTYTMSCYLLPKGMIQRLNQAFASFWWKNQDTGKGIHWRSWDKLTRSKQNGGLGFRCLEGFNLALLGKQYWRLATDPSTLLARTLKAKYYPNTSILNAALGSRPSFGWSSIHASAKLMSAGMKREIGTGSELQFWSEPWLQDTIPRPPRAIFIEDTHNWSLEDFKEEDSDQWHLENLCRVVVAEDVHRILNVKPGGEGSTSGYSWIHSTNGDYSVKSGYRLWSSQNELDNQATEQPSYAEYYKQLWQVKTSSKLLNFLWRCSTASLSVGTELKKKRITNSASCSTCGDDKEDALHMLFLCPFARAVWSLSSYAVITGDSSISVQGKIYACIQLSEEQSGEYKGLWTWLIWRIWKLRNEVIFNNAKPDPMQVYNLALSDAAEWYKNQPLATSSDHSNISTSEALSWIPPMLTQWKCNVDATWKEEHDRTGVAWILRNHTGQVTFWGVKTFPKLLSALEAEATALVWAAMCLGNMGYDNIKFECDCASVIEAMNNPSKWPRLRTFTSEMQAQTARRTWNIGFSKVNRRRNKAADALAKFAKDKELYFGHIDNQVPQWLEPFLDVEPFDLL